MKRVNLVKYGFVRWPEEDFSDDGSRFTCYQVGNRVRVSKLVADGQAYIDATLDGRLPYEVYSNLPYYCDLGRLNGVSAAGITEEDLQRLYESCLAYEAEYIKAEGSIQYPTIAEISLQCKKIHARAIFELTEAERLFNRKAFDAAMTLSDYYWRTLKERLVELNKRAHRFDSENAINKFATGLYGQSYSFNFCKPTNPDLSASWYFTDLCKLFNQV